MAISEHDVRPHHAAAATMWGQGGRAYDEISFGIGDALAHTAQRLSPRAGQEILDVATGTGWTARNVARLGARVTAVDIAPELLAAAAELSAHVRPAIEFHRADAEALPFRDGRFDGVISTFGVMFAANPARAAAELGRVCRPGGRVCLATWSHDGSIAEFFAIIGRHAESREARPKGSAPASPLAWGDPSVVERLLGRDFELTFETGVSQACYDDHDDIWRRYSDGFGPIKQLAERLDTDQCRALRADLDAFHERYRTPMGLRLKREYLVTRGIRR